MMFNRGKSGVLMNLGRYRKTIAAAVGAIAAIVSLNLVHGTAQTWLVGIVTVATALGVYTVPNQPPTPSTTPPAPPDRAAATTTARTPPFGY